MLLYSESDQKCAKNYSDRKLSYLKFLNYRKEKLSPPFISLKSIRAFFFTTPVGWKCWKGTLTVEAALVVPVFLFLMIAVLQYAQTMEASVCYGAALAEVGRGQAVQVYTAPDISGTGTALRQMSTGAIRGKVYAAAGNSRAVKDLRIEDGQSVGDANVLELRMTYRVQNVTGIYLPRITFLQKVCVRAWTGREGIYHADGSTDAKGEGKTVYVAATGKVYHTDPYCTHLKLSIREVGAQMVGQLRNKSGEKYHACERCHAGSAGSVYITGEGNRYHGSLACSGLKRTVEEVLQEDCDLRPCSKCAEPYLYVE